MSHKKKKQRKELGNYGIASFETLQQSISAISTQIGPVISSKPPLLGSNSTIHRSKVYSSKSAKTVGYIFERLK